ncbi:hypothetical protein PTHTG4_09750 [Parageobacillus thermoglucosidasius]|uniref:ParB/RepB/Spo0J family partition protein n=1 Tax=Parageobacillus thermoglucosidasius TaxID=1426 RepID=UPI000FF978EE|nr:hypothetical protein PTHTG4_09750 [Parageobacillus thermoglucosidasius]
MRIAKELGMTEVPVEIVDVDEWQAEYLLIAENVERRGQAETDPIKKARIAQFLKEYWGVQHGGNRASGQNGHLKTRQDIADAIGEDKRTTRRLLKLNDLIPELQSLVSAGKLGTTAAEQLAYLTPDVQRQLLALKGDLSGTSVGQAKEYRKQAKEGRRLD